MPTAEDIELPFAPKKPEPPQESAPPKDVRPPEPISEVELEALRAKKSTTINGMQVLGDYEKFPDFTDIPIRYCCHCVRWDLTKAEDRAAYGDLIAKSLSTSSTVEVSWEERSKEDSGLVVYLTYFEYIRVAEVK